MSQSIARKFEREFRQNARNKDSIAFERERIRQLRREAATRAGKDAGLVKLQETPEQKRRRWQGIADERAQEVKAKLEQSLRRAFLIAAERGNARRIAAGLDEGLPVNAQDPETGETALHIAGAVGARTVVRALLAAGECNHLLRDKQGRLPSECAYLFGGDPALARLLASKERRQAEKEGARLTRRPAPSR